MDTSIGILITSISAFLLGLTVITDKLMVGDFYQSDPHKAWFISSFLGTILGLIATGLAWLLFAEPGLLTTFVNFTQEYTFSLAFPMFIIGVLVSLNLLSYFECMSQNAISAKVAIAISASPILVFSAELLINGEGLHASHIISVIVTLAGLIGFELMSKHGQDRSNSKINWPLIKLLALSTTYLVSLDFLLPIIEGALNLDETQTSLVTMPFYWLGFALGILNIRKKDVRTFAKDIFTRWHFLSIIIALEIIGAGFYFFEFFGLSQINATHVALITGAHIAIVWIGDLIIRAKYERAVSSKSKFILIFFFKLPTANLSSYELSRSSLLWQGTFIVLTLYGLSLWP